MSHWYGLDKEIIPIGMIFDLRSVLGQIRPDRFFFVQWKMDCDKIVPKGMNMNSVSDHRALGKLIRAERKSQKLTQEQLAALSGVGVRFVRELENGKESCRIGLAFTVMQTLGLSVHVTGRGSST